jgi:SAM-dependent methyltransferase
VLDQLDLLPAQTVLEVGSGSGHALSEAARRTRDGHVVGLDISELMVRLARGRNRQGIAHGTVDVRAGDIESLPLEGSTFDRIFSVHCICFWRDVESTLPKLAAALRPQGKLVLAFRPEGEDVPVRFRDPTYRFPRMENLSATLTHAGLEIHRAESSIAEPGVLIVTAARR